MMQPVECSSADTMCWRENDPPVFGLLSVDISIYFDVWLQSDKTDGTLMCSTNMHKMNEDIGCLISAVVGAIQFPSGNESN